MQNEMIYKSLMKNNEFSAIFKRFRGEFWISGGSLVSEVERYFGVNKIHKSKDYDIYFSDKVEQEYFLKKANDYKVLYENENCLAIKIPGFEKYFELMKRFYHDGFETINNFDLEHCRNFLTRDEFYGGASSLHDIQFKTINFAPQVEKYSLEDFKKTLKRTQKYMKSGYALSPAAQRRLLCILNSHLEFSEAQDYREEAEVLREEVKSL